MHTNPLALADATVLDAPSDAVATVVGADRPLARVRGGLTEEQRRFLNVRLLYGSDAEAAASLPAGKRIGPLARVSPDTVVRWKRDPEFMAAYDSLWTEEAAWAKAELHRLLGKGLATIEALLDAESPVRTKLGIATIPVTDADGAERQQVVTAPDWQAQAKGAEMLLRANGLWQPEAQAQAANPAAEAFAALGQIALRRLAELEHAQAQQQAQARAEGPDDAEDHSGARRAERSAGKRAVIEGTARASSGDTTAPA